MEIRILKTFLGVAECGSISRAAERLHTVQSNVTARIKRLESELGVDLFYRRSQGLELTPAGEVLQGYARRVLQLLDEARQVVTDPDGAAGRLRLGTLETTLAARLPPVLARFRRAYPSIELVLETGSTEELMERVLTYQLEGAFVAGVCDRPELDQQPVFAERLVLASEATRESIDSLRDEVLLVFRPGCAYRARAELWLLEEGHLPVRRMEFGSLDAILGCVAAGLGVTLLPAAVVDRPPYCGLLRLHPIPERYSHLPTRFVYRRDVMPPPALRALLAFAGAEPETQ